MTDKESYQYLGTFPSPSKNFLWYVDDVTTLPHYTESDHDFMWSDIQFSKQSSTRQLIMVDIGNGEENLVFLRSQCRGVKKCQECDQTVPNTTVRNTCSDHPSAPLVRITDCDVEFVYLRPENPTDNRRWTGGLLRQHNITASTNFHNHKATASHRIPKKVRNDIAVAVEANPSLTASQLSCGHGLQYRPAAADLSAAHQGRLNSLKRQTIKKGGFKSKGPMALLEMETLADRLDNEDSQVEGSSKVSDEYNKRGRPYMRRYAITSSLIYQLIMSPLMSSVLAKAEYIEVDTTYNENSDLPYLLNITAFDYTVMRWVAVARVRSNKENVDFYASAFKAVFEQCKEDHNHFTVGKSLKGIVMDWSDTERAGLESAIGKDMSEKLIVGCRIHYSRSYQRVADRVSNSLSREYRQLSRSAFNKIASRIPLQKEKSIVMKLFNCLKGSIPLNEVSFIGLTDEQTLCCDEITRNWKEASHWVEWWTRLPHLRMLCEPFSTAEGKSFMMAPKDTNGVERVNLDSKQTTVVCLRAAMEFLYKKDKCLALAYMASERECSISYRAQTEESRRESATKRRKQRAKVKSSDFNALYGPPDKRSNFGNESVSKKDSQIGNDTIQLTDSDDDFSDLPLPAKKRQDTGLTKRSVSPRGCSSSCIRPQNSGNTTDLLQTKKETNISFSGIGQRVEVRYDDDVWYKGTLANFDLDSGEWLVRFDDDNETTSVKFPDEDVRLIK